jgi:hypothetical protein
VQYFRKAKGLQRVTQLLQVYERMIIPDDPVFMGGEIESTNGRKTITPIASHSLIISDPSGQESISTLYRRVGWRVLETVLAGLFIIIIILFCGKGK